MFPAPGSPTREGPIRRGHPWVTGRHPLPDPERLAARFRQWGLGDSDVVLYDDGPGAFAARAWWLLLWLGKRDGIYLLDGGLKAWCEAGLPMDEAIPDTEPGTFSGRADSSLIIDASALQERLDDPQLALLDARALPRFGEVEPIDPIAGHIPNATCVPFTENLSDDGRFLPVEQLRRRFEPLLGNKPPQRTVAYCGSGVTACHNLFALCLAGYPLVTLYPGLGASGSPTPGGLAPEFDHHAAPAGAAWLTSHNTPLRFCRSYICFHNR